jgi:aromatic-L-amino-acid/L-tryptophan decarboxylase
MDWLARMVNLPKEFTSDSTGGGVIHGTASEAVLVAVVAARHRAIKQHGLEKDANANGRLTVYCSSQTHSCVKKACMIAGIHMDHLRTLDVDPATLSLQPAHVEATVKADLAQGLIPIFMCATIGTTSTTASDPVDLIGKICPFSSLSSPFASLFPPFPSPLFRHEMGITV